MILYQRSQDLRITTCLRKALTVSIYAIQACPRQCRTVFTWIITLIKGTRVRPINVNSCRGNTYPLF